MTLVAFEDDVDGAIERTTKRIAAEGVPGDQDRSVIFALQRMGRLDEARGLAAQVRARWPRGDFAWFDVDPAASGLDPESRFGRFADQWADALRHAGLVDTPTPAKA